MPPAGVQLPRRDAYSRTVIAVVCDISQVFPADSVECVELERVNVQVDRKDVQKNGGHDGNDAVGRAAAIASQTSRVEEANDAMVIAVADGSGVAVRILAPRVLHGMLAIGRRVYCSASRAFL